MIIAVASRKASPGVTTLTALLAAYWYEPGATRLIIEADPSGGTLAARWSAAHGLTWDPGLLTLSSTRSRLETALLPTVSQQIGDGLWAAPAPPAPEQVAVSLARMGDAGAAALAAAAGLRVFVDCGRLWRSSPALALAQRAALTVLVCRPRLDEIHALVPAVTELAEVGCTLGLVCLGDGPYRPVEVAQTIGVELLGVLPVDHRAAAALDQDGFGAGRALRRSPLAQGAEELAGLVLARSTSTFDLDDGLGPPPPPPRPAHRDLADGQVEEGNDGAVAEVVDFVRGQADNGPGQDSFPVSPAMLVARASKDGESWRPGPGGRRD